MGALFQAHPNMGKLLEYQYSDAVRRHGIAVGHQLFFESIFGNSVKMCNYKGNSYTF